MPAAESPSIVSDHREDATRDLVAGIHFLHDCFGHKSSVCLTALSCLHLVHHDALAVVVAPD